MTEKELRRLSRADLLEMLIDQSREMHALRARLEAAETALRKREIIIGSSGSIAEAALRINGVFEAAQAACEQYIENVRLLSERQDAFYRQIKNDQQGRTAAQESGGAAEAESSSEVQSSRRRRRGSENGAAAGNGRKP